MFSEELREPDRNTVQLMIDEMQEELNGQKRAKERQQMEERIRQLEQSLRQN